MSPVIMALLALVAGLAVIALFGWMGFYGEQDAHQRTRDTLRREVHRRMDAETALDYRGGLAVRRRVEASADHLDCDLPSEARHNLTDDAEPCPRCNPLVYSRMAAKHRATPARLELTR